MYSTRPPENAARDRAALEAIVGAHFMLERASSWSVRSLQVILVPSLVLWMRTKMALPGLVTWAAQLTWAASACLVVVFTCAVLKWSRILEAELPATRLVARMRFGPQGVVPSRSSALFLLALAASTGLWFHAAAPSFLSDSAVALFERSWLGFSVAGVGLLGVELLA